MVSLALLALMVINLVGLIVAAVADLDDLVKPLGLGVIPGSFPLGLVLFVHLSAKTSQWVRYRPLYDERRLFVRAHRLFREAIGEHPGHRPSFYDD